MTGGVKNWQTYLDSTEIFVPALSQTSWTDVGKLPSPRNGLAAVSLNNNVFVMGKDQKAIYLVTKSYQPFKLFFKGGYYSTENFWPDQNAVTQSETLKFNTETLEWTKVGDMQRKRSYLGVSVVSSEDVLPYCVTEPSCAELGNCRKVVTHDEPEEQFNDDVVPPVGFP